MRYAKIIVGNILVTSAYAFLTVPQKIVNGGVTSFSMILSPAVGWDTAVLADMVTVLLLVLCYLFLGSDYFRGTVVGGICYMVFFTGFHAMGISLIPNRPLAALTAAVMVGCGYYLCISQRATAISFDTVALILNRRNPRMNVAAVMFGINTCVLMLGLYRYGISSVLLGIAFSAVQSVVLNVLLKRQGTSACAMETS